MCANSLDIACLELRIRAACDADTLNRLCGVCELVYNRDFKIQRRDHNKNVKIIKGIKLV